MGATMGSKTPGSLKNLPTNVKRTLGTGREHRIPLVRIRCMTDRCFKELKRTWRGLGGKPLRHGDILAVKNT